MDANFLNHYYDESDIISILGVKKSTMVSRTSSGTEHPPFIKIGRKKYYPKVQLLEWAKTRPLIFEVRRIFCEAKRGK